MNSFYEKLDGDPLRGQKVDKSAFSHARRKIDNKVYEKLNTTFINDVEDAHLSKRFSGFRVFGVDGTILALPDHQGIREAYDCWGGSQGESGPRARVSSLYDCLNHISYDHQIINKGTGERELALQHIENTDLSEQDIICFDRGYPAFWLFHKVMQAKAHFCARMADTWKDVKSFKKDERRTDEIITIPIRAYAKKECLEHNIEETSITLRLVKVILPSGEIEVLATSIIDQTKDNQWFKKLYNIRWQTEENYKVIKTRIRIQNFTTRTTHGIEQEFHAQMLMLNISSVIRSVSEVEHKHEIQKKNTKSKKGALYKIHFTAALSKFRKLGAMLFFVDMRSTLSALISNMAEDLARILGGRSFSRQKSKKQGYKQSYPHI